MSNIHKVLFITLSNIGDVILTLPVLDRLREDFPQSKITVMVGPRPKEIFQDNSLIDKLIIYHKHSGLKEKIKLFNELKKEKFDAVVDLRNTFFGAFLPAKYKLPLFLNIPKRIRHMQDRHLYKIINSKSEILNKSKIKNHQGGSLDIKSQEEYVKDILGKNRIVDQDKIVVIAAGARSSIKRWPKEQFLALIQLVIEELGVKVILVGDKDDTGITKYIIEHSRYPLIDLVGKTTIPQLGCLLKRAGLLIANDSAVLHIASYLNVPVLAIFGPTDDFKYGPWSRNSAIAKKEIFCRPCEEAQCRFGTLDCLRLIKPEELLGQLRNMLTANPKSQTPSPKFNFKRILIARTDRIGDVLLSTPVIKTLRENYPHAYIAMIVSPYAKEIVEGNPYLDEVIIYDKENKHKGWFGSLKFALELQKKQFDLAIILHPTNRIHLVTFFAGIPKRIGYALKAGFLLTDKIRHTKQLGEKHELEYNFDLLKHLGIKAEDKNMYIPKMPQAEKWAEELFKEEGIKSTDKLLAIHPGASCPSKIWPNLRFAEVADKLIDKYGFKVLILAGPKDVQKAEAVVKNMRHSAINLAGRTSVSQLASILRRCMLFISNDSGPVHVSSAVGTPAISLFGRAQRGLGPKRWGPLGAKDRFLHKEVGCIECLAHNCKKEFACLKAITVDDVLNTVDLMLKL